MKQSGADAVAEFRGLLLRYQGTLDLLSKRGIEDIDRLLSEAGRYADVIRREAPAARRILDVGSGAGLPGVVIAASLPGCEVVLTERRRRRAGFLRLAVGRLGLANVEVVQGDVTEIGALAADVVVAQAVSDLAGVYRMTERFLVPGGLLLSRRGPAWGAEVEALRAEVGQGVAVVAEEALEHRGTLVALRIAGGRGCRSSA